MSNGLITDCLKIFMSTNPESLCAHWCTKNIWEKHIKSIYQVLLQLEVFEAHMCLFLKCKEGACGPCHVKFSAGKGLDEMAMLMPAERESLSVHLSCSASPGLPSAAAWDFLAPFGALRLGGRRVKERLINNRNQAAWLRCSKSWLKSRFLWRCPRGSCAPVNSPPHRSQQSYYRAANSTYHIHTLQTVQSHGLYTGTTRALLRERAVIFHPTATSTFTVRRGKQRIF